MEFSYRPSSIRVVLSALFIAFTVSVCAYFVSARFGYLSVSVEFPVAVVGTETETVRWNVQGPATNVDVYVSFDDGLSFNLLETALPVNGTYEWTVPNIDAEGLRIRIDARNGDGRVRGRALSEPFSVSASPSSSVLLVKDIQEYDPVAAFFPDRDTIDQSLPNGIAIGDLVRSKSLPAVYFIGGAGERHPFPNETIYFSWFSDFESVKTVDDSVLAEIDLGPSVRVRPGTWLVKIASTPSVYAVEPGGILRFVPSEATAKLLYGENWNRRIIDVDPTLFFSFVESSPVCNCGMHTTGSVIEKEGIRYYVSETGDLRPFEDDEAFHINLFQDRFVVQGLAPDFTRGIGPMIRAHEEVLTDYQDIAREN